MTDPHELLADADKRIEAITNLCGEGTADLVTELAAALRAALAARAEPLMVLARIGRMYLDALDEDPENKMLTLPEAMAVTDVRDAVEHAEAAAWSATPEEGTDG